MFLTKLLSILYYVYRIQLQLEVNHNRPRYWFSRTSRDCSGKSIQTIKRGHSTGKLVPGQCYTENQFAETLDISRTPVREAVSDLINDKLLVSVPRRGLMVREFSETEVEQVFLLRRVIEGEVLNKVVKTITAEGLTQLKRLLSEQEEAMEAQDKMWFIELDQRFHNSLIEIAGYHLVKEMVVYLHNLTRLIGHQALLVDGRMDEVIKEHREIVKAIEEKDYICSKEKMALHLKNTETSYQRIHHQGEKI